MLAAGAEAGCHTWLSPGPRQSHQGLSAIRYGTLYGWMDAWMGGWMGGWMDG